MWFTIKLDNTSYIKLNSNISKELKNFNSSDFEELWKLKPDIQPKIKIFGKEVTCPRYFQNYGCDYNFSNVNHKAKPIPIVLEKYLNYVNLKENGDYNNILVNYYENKDHYIGYHSDNEKQLVKKSNIYCFSLGSERYLHFQNKKDKSEKKYKLNDKSCVIMGGDCQKNFKHSIPKEKKNIGPRISITIRKFSPKINNNDKL